MSEFFHMGGYAFYVWTSYGLATVVLTAIALSPLLRKKQLIKDFARRERRARRES